MTVKQFAMNLPYKKAKLRYFISHPFQDVSYLFQNDRCSCLLISTEQAKLVGLSNVNPLNAGDLHEFIN